MKCYVDITTDDNEWREYIAATDIGETVVKLKHCMIKNEPIVLKDDCGNINIINCDRLLTIKIRRVQDD